MSSKVEMEEPEQQQPQPPKTKQRPNLCKKLFRLKNLAVHQDTEENNDDSEFKKVLGTRDLVSLGVGSCVGTGMYLVSGMVAKNTAGPAVVLSYAIAGVAALCSGFCYAELGVRVPHTTGSAYVYSYVAVGEFVAFVIGWNMILEYIIGTAACACALSTLVDILSAGAISNITDAWSGGEGDIITTPPDILAFVITLAMMIIFLYGVKSAVIFNHVLNVFNLISLIIIVCVGLPLGQTSNWSDDFMPYGFTGVLKGAATCFYAFIGFDIIATTGEEAKSPKDSIPKAIVGSLAIVTVSYVACSSVMTLMVPYEALSEDAGLVQIWGQKGYSGVEWIISICALGALTVSMFGSMFPMPRVAYAMAKDGLLCPSLARVNKRGVPALANLCLSLLAAFGALLFPLNVLIEMISIGTLLAYTIVDSCVLILRYLPERKSLVDVFYGEEEDDDDEEGGKNSTYDELPPNVVEGEQRDNEGGLWSFIRLLLNGQHPSQKRQTTSREGARIVIRVFLCLIAFILVFDVILVIGEDSITQGFTLLLLFVVVLCIICASVAMAHFPQAKPKPGSFSVPCVPVVPIFGILINVYLIFCLSKLTLLRFSVWMVLGLIVYFKYGLWDNGVNDG